MKILARLTQISSTRQLCGFSKKLGVSLLRVFRHKEFPPEQGIRDSFNRHMIVLRLLNTLIRLERGIRSIGDHRLYWNTWLSDSIKKFPCDLIAELVCDIQG